MDWYVTGATEDNLIHVLVLTTIAHGTLRVFLHGLLSLMRVHLS